VHPLDKSYTRNTLDVNAVPVLKHVSHLPVIIDPSHGIGVSRYVPAIAGAGIAAGADGLIIEVHPDPRKAMSDGAQSLNPTEFADTMTRLRKIAAAIDRTI
jgi:3-deoxy-7-phosphoheptulonate synthase